MGYIALKEGSTLQSGKYIIAEILGQGGFGITYEANQVSLGRKVAIKEFFMKEYCERVGSTSHVSVPSSGSRELVERFRQKFLREARMIASLNHPNIVKIYDVFEENGTAYYVMEHLSGGSLSDKVRDNGPLSEEQCIDYICQVSSALDYLHRRKTLHFDVKPSNILFDEDGRAVLIDFGISKHYDTGGHQTSSTPVGLSKGFAPLEQYRQDEVSTFTPATDIYSLGATLYYLATGTTPPDASWVNEEGLERPDGLSDRVWNTIACAMQPRRKDRLQSISEFLSLLDGKSGTAGHTADDIDDETTRMDAAAFHTRPESRFASASPPSSDSKSRQESKPKQAPKPIQKSNSSKKSRIDSGTNRYVVSRKGFPKWLYGVAAALIVGLIVFIIIPKSKRLSEPVAVDNGHEYVDLGLSVKWATCNVGATKPEDYGDYYAWGEISTKSSYTWENYRFRTSGDSNGNVKLSKYNTDSGRGFVDNKTTLDLSDDVARTKWGGSWRMPTDEEFQELIDNCTWTWTIQNGVNGYKVTSKKSGHSGRSIFLPAAGCHGGAGLTNIGTTGSYWSSSHSTSLSDIANSIGFDSDNVNRRYSTRDFGRSVRAICP